VTTLVVVVIVTPVCLAMPVAIDSVAVLVSIRAMVVRPVGDDTTRYVHECSDRAQYSYPIESIHSLVLLKVVPGGNIRNLRPAEKSK
jgi:hypothetical protein